MARPGSLVRSFLFAPGNHPRKVEKVFTSGADAAILDLEDAVAESEKTATRPVLVTALKQDRGCLGYVRVNPVDSPYFAGDMQAVVGPWMDGVVLPKVERGEQLRHAAQVLAEQEHEHGMAPGCIDLMAIVETAAGVENALEIAGASERLGRMAFGAGDYTLDLDYQWGPDEQTLAYARSRLSHASRIAGLQPPIDTVVLQIYEDDRFLASAGHGRAFGFGGKLCIHPRQVALCHRVFSPSPEEIEHARRVVEAFAAAERDGSASIQLDGYFIDYPIVYKARRVVALADRLGLGADGQADLSEEAE
ncbi:MAG: HpcH/HpaI aldolase/citrate lyase family protein [Lysobacterales bacterium]